MKTIKQALQQITRILKINVVLARNGLDNVLVTIPYFMPFRFIVYLNPWNWFRKQSMSRGEALRKTLEELGPIFIKFGQALSTRPDILPPDIAEELAKLQDSVPPFPSEVAIAILESSFGQPIDAIFKEFDPISLASASMAQVHAATLHTGEEVVVKILRPNLQKTIEDDLSILSTFAGLAEKYWSHGKRLKPREMVREFEYSLLDELDLQREAANASQLRRNFMGSPLLHVPEVYWDYTRQNIFVMERIRGIPVSDVAALQAAGINIKKLAERGVEIFFTQVFRDCFFHADMHPGNIFVSYEHLEEPQYICIDFGIVGTLNDNDKRYLAENFYAFFKRDYRRVAQLHVESGWVHSDTRIDAFENAIRTVCEPIFERPLKDISLAQLMLRLFQVARRFHMEVQPQLLLLQKTLLAIEGLGRQLYPELDLWTTASPFLERWLKAQMGPRVFLRHIRENLPFFAEQLPHLPRLLFDVLELSKRQKIGSLALLEESQEARRLNGLQSHWYRGFALGAAITALATSFIVYFRG